MPSHDHVHRRHPRAADPFAFPDPFANPGPAPEAQAASTIVMIVYTTQSPTFAGPVASLSTPAWAVDSTSDAPVAAATTTSTPPPAAHTSKTRKASKSSDGGIVADTATSSSPAQQTTLATSSSTGLPASITSADTSVQSSLLAATSDISSPTFSATTSESAAAASASPSSSASSSSGGMSSAGKAGLAIGILLLLGAVLSLVLFCFKKRRDAVKSQRLEDEKHEFANVGRASSTRTTATAPRLSLRPVTQFLPNLGERRSSRGNALLLASGPIVEQPGNAWERPSTAQSNRDNPFGNHAETIDGANARGPESIGAMGPGGEMLTGAAAAGGLARGASKRGNGPKPMDFTRGGPLMGPPSPAGTEFSTSSETNAIPTPTASGAAIAAAGGPVNTAVHRVQLDFKPSMSDELELSAGQLIRLLHEYDDGWVIISLLSRGND